MTTTARPPGRSATELVEAIQHYQLRDSLFRVHVADQEVARYLERLCHQFACAAGATLSAARVIEVRGSDSGGWDIVEDGVETVHRRTAVGAARHVEWRLVGRAARAERRLVHWHAAGLTSGDHTLLLAGAPRSGKSTLALALVVAGWELVGEDIVFMEPDTGRLHPFRRAPSLRATSLPLLDAAGFSVPSALSLPGFVEVEGIARWRTEPTPPLSHIVFPEWQVEAAPAIESLALAEAAVRLQRSSFNLARWPLGGFSLLQRRLASTSCYRLLLGSDLRAAVGVVNDLVGRG